MDVTFIGSGDAFGSGGRLNPCIAVSDGEHVFTLDFGLSALTGLRQNNIAPNSIGTIIISHLHGDHCGGVPFLLMDAMLGSKRQAPLTVIGPEGIEEHMKNLQEALFPGSGIMKPGFRLDYIELSPGTPITADDLQVRAVAAVHTASTKPLALRVEKKGKSIVYTGDGECTGELIRLSEGADLLIAECYYYDKPVRWHLNYPDIHKLKAERTILTHMSGNMLEHTEDVPETCAFDGMKIVI